MKKKIIPAIIAASQEEMEKRIEKAAALDTMQLDIMDSRFVPTSSLFFDFRPPEGFRYEAHLMVADPDSWARENYAKADSILIPIESSREPAATLDFLKSMGKCAGLVLNPETPVASVLPYLDAADQILVMTVNPGFYGSPFVPEALDKVRELRRQFPRLDIEVDGSINPETIGMASEAGANLFVVGSYLQKAADIHEAINILNSKISGG